jgi:holo-[acyl-carrier protein] synthase
VGGTGLSNRALAPPTLTSPTRGEGNQRGTALYGGCIAVEIVGVGTDIVECLRIARMIERHGEQFLLRVYTDREILACNANKRTTENFAGRWAAKEAVLKALGGASARSICWTEIEVRPPGASGRPQVHLGGAIRELARGLRVADIYLSVAHCRTYATAYALAVREVPKPAGS